MWAESIKAEKKEITVPAQVSMHKASCRKKTTVCNKLKEIHEMLSSDKRTCRYSMLINYRLFDCR